MVISTHNKYNEYLENANEVINYDINHLNWFQPIILLHNGELNRIFNMI